MILERIKEFIEKKGLSIASFERSVGMSNASFSKAVKSGKAIGTDKLENILNTYPELSAEWLCTGEGTMLKGEGHVAPSEVHPSEKKSTATTPDAATLMALLHDKDATIRQLSEQIGILKERIRGIERDKAKPASPALDTPDALIG